MLHVGNLCAVYWILLYLVYFYKPTVKNEVFLKLNLYDLCEESGLFLLPGKVALVFQHLLYSNDSSWKSSFQVAMVVLLI